MLTNKYSKLYFTITSRAKQRITERYTETHHIIPQSMGGNNDKDNLVELTAREHFICHWLLIKMTEGEERSKMLYALHGMKAENKFQSRYQSKITARVYEKYRIEHAVNHSKVMKAKNLVPWNKGGAILTDEQRKRISDAAKNRKPMSAEARAKGNEKRRGQKRSEETKLKMSLAAKGKPKGPMSEEQKLKRSLKQKGVPKPKGFGDIVAERMKKEFGSDNLWMNAYSNDVSCYIPSRRLYDEGGYEVDFSMAYYNKPSRFKPDTESIIISGIIKQINQTRPRFK